MRRVEALLLKGWADGKWLLPTKNKNVPGFAFVEKLT